MTEPLSSAMSFEERLAAFHRALHAGLAPAPESFLPDGPERREILIELVHAELEYRLKQGQAARVEDYLARYPELAGQPLASLVEAELRLRARQDPALDATAEKGRRFPQLTALETPPCGIGTPAAAERSPMFPCRYRRLELHASGGLGVVYRAEDEELRRQVALKEIRDRHAQDSRLQSRFVFEAEVTGRLEHPAIVPVYGQGRYPDGRPYYAMRFIQGETLEAAIHRFHQVQAHGPRPVGLASAELRGLLGRFITVCHAVAYAHSRGVIHRDIKPANIMLGAFGETFLVDWGLSRVGQGGDDALRLGPTGLAETMQGSAVGTPAYMSPEQARGQHDRMGPSSDVYSLGATLYQILTGQPPFTGDDVQAALERAARGQFARPRQLKTGIPAALEAVCLHALATRPEDRYATAQELGAEIDRWLADEPVSAYREPLTLRLRRWGRRHRAVVSGGMVALLVSVVALAVGLAAVGAEQQRTADQRDRAIEAEIKANKNLERAEKNLGLARKAVHDCYGVAKGHPLLQGEEMKEVKKLLLEKALPFFQNFQAQKPNDPGTEEDLADQLFHVGYITTELGRDEEALAAFRQARDRYQVLVDTQPDILQHRYNLAATLTHLGTLLRQQGQRELAVQTYKQALEHQRQLTLARPDNDEWQGALNRTLGELGGTLAAGGEPAKGIKTLREVIDSQRRMARGRPESTSQRATLAIALYSLARLLAAEGQTPEALKALAEARVIQTRLISEEPERTLHKTILADILNILSLALAQEGRRAEALQTRREALALLEALVKVQPNNSDYQLDLAGSSTNLGLLLAAEDKVEEAAAAYHRARDLLRPLVQRQPGASRFADYLATTLNNLGNLLNDQDQSTAALEAYTEARDLLEQLHRADPQALDIRKMLAATLTHRGLLLTDAKQKDEALQGCVRAESMLRELVRHAPTVVGYRLQWARTLNTIGVVLARQGQRPQAVKTHAQAEAILRPLIAGPAAHDARATLAATLERIALLNAEEGDLDKGIQGYADTCELAEALVEAEPAERSYQYRLAHASLELGVLLARRNKLAEARTAFTRAREVGEPLVQAHPRVIEYRNNLGRTFYNLGIALPDRAAALEAYRQARALQEPLCNDRPESAEFQHALAQTLINMGLRLAAGGEHAEALTNFTRGREIQERLVAALPAHLGYREDLARVCLNRGGLQVQAGQARAAREDFTAALTQAQELEKRHGRSALTEQIQRLASYGRARALEQLRQYREALPDWDRALALAPAALRDVPLWGRAECLARAGEYRRAIDEARLLANNTRTAQQWYTLARIAGMACSSAAEDGGRPLAEREEFVVLAALQGVTWLESSERAGFFNASSARQQLQSDAALDGLRARTEFWEFVAHIRDKKE